MGSYSYLVLDWPGFTSNRELLKSRSLCLAVGHNSIIKKSWHQPDMPFAWCQIWLTLDVKKIYWLCYLCRYIFFNLLASFPNMVFFFGILPYLKGYRWSIRQPSLFRTLTFEFLIEHDNNFFPYLDYNFPGSLRSYNASKKTAVSYRIPKHLSPSVLFNKLIFSLPFLTPPN